MATMLLLRRDEIETIWTIDRSEVHHHIYRVADGALVLTPAYFAVPGWAPGQQENDTPLLYTVFDRGGDFFGAFDGDTLIGIAVLDAAPLAPGDRLPLKYLYVSRTYRGRGIGAQLFATAAQAARERNATSLYISATPTQNTVDFYLRRGCGLADPPDPAQLAAEPHDIHFECAV